MATYFFTGNEEYVIQLFINSLSPSWNVNTSNQNKTVSDVLKTLKQYVSISASKFVMNT